MAEEKKPVSETPPPADASKPEADPKKAAGKPKLALPILKPREKSIFQVFIFCFALLIVDLVLIHPLSNYLRKLDETIHVKEEVIPKRLLILKHKDHILHEYGQIKPFFISSSITQEEETAQFLREIEKVSKETGFFVTNINPVKITKRSDTIYELSLDVEGRGGLKETRTFMRTVESSNPSIRVASFDLKPQSKEADELKVLLTIVKLGVKKDNSTSAA